MAQKCNCRGVARVGVMALSSNPRQKLTPHTELHLSRAAAVVPNEAGLVHKPAVLLLVNATHIFVSQ